MFRSEKCECPYRFDVKCTEHPLHGWILLVSNAFTSEHNHPRLTVIDQEKESANNPKTEEQDGNSPNTSSFQAPEAPKSIHNAGESEVQQGESQKVEPLSNLSSDLSNIPLNLCTSDSESIKLIEYGSSSSQQQLKTTILGKNTKSKIFQQEVTIEIISRTPGNEKSYHLDIPQENSIQNTAESNLRMKESVDEGIIESNLNGKKRWPTRGWDLLHLRLKLISRIL